MKNRRHLPSHHESQISVPNSGSSVWPFISGMGLGAGIMYVLDPDRGNRRRAMAQQKLFRLAHLGGDALDKAVRDLEHRAEGLVYQSAHLLRREQVADDVLEGRVRAKLGRVACHPGSIEVRTANGHVTLSGPVLRGEAHEIARAVAHVRGVRHVESRVEEHDASENLPGLQGRGQRPGDKPELLQENWAPGTRLIMGGLGLSLIARAIRHPGFLNLVTGVLGFALLARSGRHTRMADTLMDTLKPASGPRAGRRHGREGQARGAGLPAGEGRRDVVGRTGVYPATGPLPPRPAEVRTAGSFGQGERGAAGYEDHGTSGLSYSGETVLGAMPETGAVRSIDLQSLLKPRDIPREQWMNFFNELDKGLDWPPVTVEVYENGKTRIEQRDVPLDGIGADVKDRESIITVGVGRRAEDLVIHTIPARRVAVRESGDCMLLEMESTDGTVTVVRFRKADLRPRRIVA